ncbi:MAG: ABC transporter permease [Planctomycetaceae bacterium]|nr:ABC transporter permease [Planctomycetaceae bacterium]
MLPRRVRQLLALMKKEMLQVVRDPSSILIAFVLPMILLFIFGYGLSLDAKHVRLAIVLEDHSPNAQSLWLALMATDYVKALAFDHRSEAEQAIVDGRVRGVLVVPGDFSRQLQSRQTARVQLITDGCETNTATILENYILGIIAKWSTHQLTDQGFEIKPVIDVFPRVYFNPELNTRNALIPGSIVLIMAIIGTLLTALVVSREWERGTMEAMLATPVRKIDMIVGKLLPYYLLGMASTTVCTLVGIFLFEVPFRGSVVALGFTSTVFLVAALGQGFLISTVCKNQFLASQVTLVVAYLPNFMLSGALFEISSMPFPIRMLTYVFPARYYVSCLQTIFMTGDIWPLILKNIGLMLIIGIVVFFAAIAKTPKRLE